MLVLNAALIGSKNVNIDVKKSVFYSRVQTERHVNRNSYYKLWTWSFFHVHSAVARMLQLQILKIWHDDVCQWHENYEFSCLFSSLAPTEVRLILFRQKEGQASLFRFIPWILYEAKESLLMNDYKSVTKKQKVTYSSRLISPGLWSNNASLH